MSDQAGAPPLLTAWARALADPALVARKGGYLFKAGVADGRLLLAVAPWVIEGMRTYHHDLCLEHEDAFTLIGAVDANGVFSIVFKPARLPLSEGDRAAYQAAYRRLAAELLAAGYAGPGCLDALTRDLLGQLGAAPPPRTLAALLR